MNNPEYFGLPFPIYKDLILFCPGKGRFRVTDIEWSRYDIDKPDRVLGYFMEVSDYVPNTIRTQMFLPRVTMEVKIEELVAAGWKPLEP